ncbi:ABC transporter substrate-binding protein [candidate division WOR-3 bacterium]|nr:ABC transporter substrate-binding protein [candidate division WOR-3 bacterium]
MRRAMAVVAAVVLLAGTGCQESETVKVGVVAPLTGDVMTFGESMRNGALMAFEEANAAGGVGGRLLQVMVRDDANEPGRAAEAGRELVEQEAVVAVLGSVSTECTLPLADICQAAGVPLVVPASTNPKVTVAPDGARRVCVFRACFTDSFQGAVAAKFARGALDARTAAVLFNSSDEYSRGLAGFFRDAFVAAGGQVPVFESYAAGEEDFRAQLEFARVQAADVLFLPDYYSRVARVVRQARELGLRTTLLGGDGWDSPEMPEQAGDAILGGYFTNHFSPDEPRPEVKEWVNRYKSKYGEPPDALATLGHDAALLLVEALRRAPQSKPAEVCVALAATSDFQGVSGAISFDEHGNAVKNVVIAQYRADGVRFVTTERP